MHCLKIINVNLTYGNARMIILSSITFFISFCFSYVLLGFNKTQPFTDNGFMLFLFGLFLIYPMHKFIHYLFLIDYTKNMKIKIRRKYMFLPSIHLKIKKLVPKYRYLSSLIAPFVLLSILFIFLALSYPTTIHYFSIYFAIHCSICLIDLLFVKDIITTPHNSFIEETPKGYEVLVPHQRS